MLLQDKRIETNLQDKYGWTALSWASYEGHKEFVTL
jgi:ankyrin repeat protein